MNIHSLYTRIRKARLLWQPRPNKLLYEHIPKCGGTSIYSFLRTQYRTNRTFRLDGSNPAKSISHFKSLPESQRHAYDLIIGHRAFQLREQCHPNMQRAVIFREPIDRIISHYYFVLRTPAHYLHEQVTQQKMSLFDYATTGISVELRNNYIARFLNIPAEEAEQTPEASVEKAFTLIQETFGLIGILERIDAAAEAIVDYTQVSDSWEPIHSNKTAQRPQIESLDPKTVQAIADINFLDVALFKKIRAAAI